MKQCKRIFVLLLAACLLLTGCAAQEEASVSPAEASLSSADASASSASSSSAGEDYYILDTVPDYSGEPYVVLCGNEPDFSEDDLTTDVFETYSELDELGRCGVAYANVCLDTMPTEARESISQVIPTGWQNATYDFVDGGYVYNRCHLIGYQLTAENANEKNLITGTRYLNVEGMLPFENLVADYVTETEYHVLYRVTPIFEGDELVARGVQMEALSVEDEGEGVCFNVYCYNVQPGVVIDYATGANEPEETDGTAETDSSAEGETSSATESTEETTYILNTSSKKFHRPDCSSVQSIKEDNREIYTGSREDLIEQGYDPCGSCDP